MSLFWKIKRRCLPAFQNTLIGFTLSIVLFILIHPQRTYKMPTVYDQENVDELGQKSLKVEQLSEKVGPNDTQDIVKDAEPEKDAINEEEKEMTDEDRWRIQRRRRRRERKMLNPNVSTLFQWNAPTFFAPYEESYCWNFFLTRYNFCQPVWNFFFYNWCQCDLIKILSNCLFVNCQQRRIYQPRVGENLLFGQKLHENEINWTNAGPHWIRQWLISSPTTNL